MPPKPHPKNLRLMNGRGNGRDSGGRLVEPGHGWVRLPPTPPAWLVGEGRALWDRVVAELEPYNILKPTDGPALTCYCVAWQLLLDATETVRREGMIIHTDGGPRRHPAVQIAEAAGRELRAWANEFGLTPAGKLRLGAQATDDAEDNPFS